MLKSRFRGGVHPEYNKELSAAHAIESIPLPKQIEIPLSQHLGVPSKPVVTKGDKVVPGQLLAEASGYISANIHTPVTGTVQKFTNKPMPGGSISEYINIQVNIDATEKHLWERRTIDLADIDRKLLTKTVRQAGIVGMGGATFPTDIKYSPPKTIRLDTFIINGAECEPYLTCDHRVMVEYVSEIIEGIQIINAAFKFTRIVVAIEKNKPDALEAFQKIFSQADNSGIEVLPLDVRYPQGAEKMLISAVTGRAVPEGKLPYNVGVLVSNVQTLYAIQQAFFLNKPLVDRVVTVSGKGIAEPKNIRTIIGTPVSYLAEYCGGISTKTTKVVVGGAMTGTALPTLDYAVTKGFSGILFLTQTEFPDESPCIHCGRCVDVCPMRLMPLKLAALAKVRRFEELKTSHLMGCFECGSCNWVCPSHIKIVSWIKYAKNYIRVRGI